MGGRGSSGRDRHGEHHRYRPTRSETQTGATLTIKRCIALTLTLTLVECWHKKNALHPFPTAK